MNRSRKTTDNSRPNDLRRPPAAAKILGERGSKRTAQALQKHEVLEPNVRLRRRIGIVRQCCELPVVDVLAIEFRGILVPVCVERVLANARSKTTDTTKTALGFRSSCPCLQTSASNEFSTIAPPCLTLYLQYSAGDTASRDDGRNA